MTPAAIVAPRPASAVAWEAVVAPVSAAVAPDAADDSAEIYYPSSDDCPVAEGNDHYLAIAHVYDALRRWFRSRGDVYVAADMFVYYEEGDTGARVAPDLFVVRGVDPRQCETWKIWEEEDRPPQFVLEVASRSTRDTDRNKKPGIYRTLGVDEYFQFDLLRKPGAVLRSEMLGLDLFPADRLLRLGDPLTGERLPTSEEEEDGRLEERARADKAEARVRELEARLRSRSG